MHSHREPPLISNTGVFTIVVAVVFALIVGIAGCPQYTVYQRGLKGKAMLREAEFSRKIAIEEAQAKLESSSKLAEAEVIRAAGVAEANAIIGDSLKNNDAYLRYLWINGLHDGSSEVIYIATEANLPILEARDNRR
jgi:hypothetical protein